jgi:hypothetical protein
MTNLKDVDPEQRFWALAAWLRRNFLLVTIFSAMIVLQFLTSQQIITFPVSRPHATPITRAMQ